RYDCILHGSAGDGNLYRVCAGALYSDVFYQLYQLERPDPVRTGRPGKLCRAADRRGQPVLYGPGEQPVLDGARDRAAHYHWHFSGEHPGTPQPARRQCLAAGLLHAADSVRDGDMPDLDLDV